VINLLLVTGQPRHRFLRVRRRRVRVDRGPEEEGVVVGAGDDLFGVALSEGFVAFEGEGFGWRWEKRLGSEGGRRGEEGRTLFIRSGMLRKLVEGTGTKNKVGVERHRVDPVSVLRKRSDELSLLVVKRVSIVRKSTQRESNDAHPSRPKALLSDRCSPCK
jgi:hypothetical protein